MVQRATPEEVFGVREAVQTQEPIRMEGLQIEAGIEPNMALAILGLIAIVGLVGLFALVIGEKKCR